MPNLQLEKLTKSQLAEILNTIAKQLSSKQYQQLEKMIAEAAADHTASEKTPVMVRMSQELVDEKMQQIKAWMKQIDEGELYLDAEEYEDYSNGYWDADWVVDYYDNQGIRKKS